MSDNFIEVSGATEAPYKKIISTYSSYFVAVTNTLKNLIAEWFICMPIHLSFSPLVYGHMGILAYDKPTTTTSRETPWFRISELPRPLITQIISIYSMPYCKWQFFVMV